MIGLKPADRLQQASKTKYLENANDVENALNSYIVDNSGSLPAAFNTLTYGYYNICKTTASGCISLTELIPKYLPSIPIDTTNATTDTTGFKLRYDPVKREVITYSNSEYIIRINSGASLNEGMVGYWKMDELSWNGTSGEVKDWSGANNNGTAVGGATTTVGKFGNGGSFDRTDNNVSIANKSNLVLSGIPFTVSAWIYPNITGQSQSILGKGDGVTATSSEYILQYNLTAADTKKISLYLNGAWRTSNNGNVIINQWSHVTAVFDGTNVSFYFNGVLDSSVSGTGAYATNIAYDLYLGRQGSSAPVSNLFSGTIDEVRIYNRALDSNEITALYNYTSDALISSAQWKFEENTGTSTFDLSGNNNTGTLNNGVAWVTGKYGKALSFDGVDDFVYINGSTSLNITPNLSVSAWVNFSNLALSNQNIVAKRANGGAPANYLLRTGGASSGNDTDEIQFGYYNAGYHIIASDGVNMVTGQWYYVTGTHDSVAGDKIYVNGVNCPILWKNGTASAPLIYDNESLAIGRAGGNFASQYLAGIVDEVKIYNYALTSTQILHEMQGN